jgi:hypothetical protein
MKVRDVIYLVALIALSACSVSRKPFAEQKYSPEKLKKDFTIFRGALEESHPSLYWFTPKDSMDKVFDETYRTLKDSMTEREFRTALIRVVANIRCGHTSVSYSKKYSRYLDTADLKLFPLAFKVWKDTLAVTANLHKNDSVLTRGVTVTAINNYPAKFLIDTFFNYITTDGYSTTGKYQTLSSYGTFGVLYKNLFGLTDSFRINYVDHRGFSGETTVPVFKPAPDSLDKTDSLKPEKYTPKERRNIRSYSSRNIQVDTTLKSAYMSVNTFARGNGLRRFFRYAFKNIDRLKLQHLVIDVRSNGGGDAGNSTILTQYLTDHPFVIADSLYAIKRSSRYRDYIPMQPLYWLATTIITRKKADGKFHFGYFERHTFKPKKRHHYKGNVYILTGGNSFSATTLFAQELKGQPNVKIIGEETGGGGYGNTAWIIPDLVLPNTKLRLGIPKFRFIMEKGLINEGRGVIPDIYAAPTADDIRKGVDVKLEAVKQLIIKANGF